MCQNLKNISEKRNRIHIQYKDRNSKERRRDFLKRLKIKFSAENYEEKNYSIQEYNQIVKNLHELRELSEKVIAFMCPKI